MTTSIDSNTSLLAMSAQELLAVYRDRTVSPVEVIKAVFDAIDARDGLLRCFLALNTDDALAAAREAEQRWRDGEGGALCGIPIPVKDSIEVSGMPTTYGSLAFRDNVQPDSVLVQRLRSQGAIVVGKTNLPEFALSPVTINRLGDPCRNPWNEERSAGGSSGGAAASVAAGFGPIAIGTDSGGSIRSPAAYNGIFGIKPSYQRIPAVQTWRAAPGRSHNGPITRTVDDSALLLSAIAGPHDLDPDSNLTSLEPDAWFSKPASLSNLRFALAPSESDERFGGAVAEVAGKAGLLLERLGADVIEADFPRWSVAPMDDDALPYSADHYAAAEFMAPGFLESHGDELTPFVRDLYEQGRGVLAWQYRLALRHDQQYRQRVHAWFIDNDIDYIVMQATGVAPLVSTLEEGIRAPSLRDLVHFNMARNPGASIPFGIDPESGMPLAVQIVGRLGDDAGVLGVARCFEEAEPWIHQVPILSG